MCMIPEAESAYAHISLYVRGIGKSILVLQLSCAYETKNALLATSFMFHAATNDHLDVSNYLLNLGPTDIYSLGLTLGLNHARHGHI